jgi:hypothetical protein
MANSKTQRTERRLAVVNDYLRGWNGAPPTEQTWLVRLQRETESLVTVSLARKQEITGVPPDKVRQFATLAVERRLKRHDASFWEAKYDLDATVSNAEYNFGYTPNAEADLTKEALRAVAANADGRQSSQEVLAKASSLRTQLEAFFEHYRDKYEDLGCGTRAEYPPARLAEAINILQGIESSCRAAMFEQAPLSFMIDLTVDQETLLTWEYRVSRYRGKRRHMFDLAKVWGIGRSNNMAGFNRRINGLRRAFPSNSPQLY